MRNVVGGALTSLVVVMAGCGGADLSGLGSVIVVYSDAAPPGEGGSPALGSTSASDSGAVIAADAGGDPAPDSSADPPAYDGGVVVMSPDTGASDPPDTGGPSSCIAAVCPACMIGTPCCNENQCACEIGSICVPGTGQASPEAAAPPPAPSGAGCNGTTKELCSGASGPSAACVYDAYTFPACSAQQGYPCSVLSAEVSGYECCFFWSC